MPGSASTPPARGPGAGGRGPGITRFRDLRVWQQAISLIQAIDRLTASFPETERFGLICQLRRAAVSVPSHLEIALRLGFARADQVTAVQQVSSIGKQLYALRDALAAKL